MTDGLKDVHREAIIAEIAANDRVERAVLFGSRATGTNTVSSDVDIALFGDRLTLTDQARLAAALDEIPMAQSVDLLLYDSIQDRTLREHIRRQGVEWHARPATTRSDRATLPLLAADGVGRSSSEEEGGLYRPTFPAHWKRRPLYSMARWVNGLAFRNIEFGDIGKPVIKIAEIKGGISDQTKFTRQTFDGSVRVRSGDLLFSWSGQPETSIDVFWWRGPEGWLNQHVFRVTPVDGIDTTFLFCLLRYLNPNFVAIARNKQTTGLGHVTKRDLERIEAAVPPSREQRAIAHILGTLDDKIELNRRMNATLEETARALFKSWFVGFDPVRAKATLKHHATPPHGGSDWSVERARAYLDRMDPNIATLFPDSFVDSELGPIPEGWEVVPLAEMIELNPPRPLPRGEIAPYLDMANMPTKGHTPETVIDRPFGSGMRFANGDTLLARITPCLENGKTAYVDFLKEDQIGWGSTEYIVLRPKPPLPSEFGYCLGRSAGFREFAIQNMTGTSGRQRVPATAISNYRMTVPNGLGVPKIFGELIEPLFSLASQNADESRTLATLRDTLLPKLISGELRGG